MAKIVQSEKQIYMALDETRSEQAFHNLQLAFSSPGMNEAVLPHIRLNKQGRFILPDLNLGTGTEVEEFQGILLHYRDSRAYWEGSFKGGGEMPQCISRDAITGEGEPGGDCSHCPFSQWGSAPAGKGQACRLSRTLYILRPESLLPLTLRLSPGQLMEQMTYITFLLGSMQSWDQIVTHFRAHVSTSNTGIEYNQVSYLKVRELTDIEKPLMAKYADIVTGRLKAPRMIEQPTNQE